MSRLASGPDPAARWDAAPGRDPEARIWERYRIRFDESGPGDVVRTSIYLALVQDVAWVHSRAFGFDRAWYVGRGLFWLVRAVDLRILRDARLDERLDVSTEVTAMRRIWARRRSEIRHARMAGTEATGEGELLATAEIDWVMTDVRGRPSRIPAELIELFPAPDVFDPLRVAPGAVPGTASRLGLSVRGQDVDPMGHVNNTRYLDYLEETLGAAGLSRVIATSPRRYRLEYLASATPGTRLLAEAWTRDADVAWRLSVENGPELVRAVVGG